MKRIYFPNLNGLRFLAVFIVFQGHVVQIAGILGLESKMSFPFPASIIGVFLFFVLSGFLITYLLLAEGKETNTISVRDFYLRRIFRIWPLYYLIIALGFFVLPHIHFFRWEGWTEFVYDNLPLKLTLFLLILPNLAETIFTHYLPYAAQTWSIGTEEQFYLVWPVLMKNSINKKVTLYVVIIAYMFMKLLGFPLIHQYLFWNKTMEFVEGFFGTLYIDCLAIGGLFAIYLFNQHKILSFLFGKSVQLIALLILIVLTLARIKIPYVEPECYSLLFGVLILNLAANKHTIFNILNLENKVFHYLGKISYGLYMYHPLAITVAIKILNYFSIRNWIIQSASSLLLSIIIAGLSFKYFENYFIKKKSKFSKIATGDS